MFKSAKFLSAFMLLLASSLLMAGQAEVNYQVSIVDADHHLAKVEVEFPKVETSVFEFSLPVWRTGKYQVLDLANGISELEVTGSKSGELQAQKINKNTWQIQLDKAQKVKLVYSLYADELKVRARHIDDSHMFLDASAGLLFSEGFRHLPVTVKLNVPKDWQSRSGMDKTAKHSFKAANYDVLVDSPIESGIHKFREFSQDGRDYELVVWGEGNYDLDAMIEDFIKLDVAAKDYWGTFPFKRYVYMVHVAPGIRGATEHLNSTIMHSTPYRFTKREDYLGFIQTSAHEFVHTWNVKAYRPQGITPYDYHQENYSSLFWMAEGSTSYIQQLLGLRGGTITKKEFLKSFSDSIESHNKKAGRKKMSVAEASFDAWINAGHTDSINHQVSIYQQGKLVTFMLDYEIRKRSGDKRSLQDLHKALYQQNKPFPKSYNEQELLEILEQLTGKSFEDFWQDYVWGVKELPLKDGLAYFGLELESKDSPKDKSKDSEATKSEKDANKKDKSWAGLSITSKQGFAMVSQVIADSPAWKAGLASGDLIVAINNQQASSDLIKRLEELAPKTEVNLSYFRKGRLKSTNVKLIRKPNLKLKLVAMDSTSLQQEQRFKSLTLQDLKGKEERSKEKQPKEK